MNKQRRLPIGRKPTSIRRLEIIDAGMCILTSAGARQFTAERLGAAVGITGGSIFRHFESMDEILDAIVDRVEQIILRDFPPRAKSPLEALRLFFEARVRAITENPEVSRLLLSSMLIPTGKDDYRANRLRDLRRKSHRFVVECLEQSKAAGLLADDVAPEEGSILVFGAVYAIGHMGGEARAVVGSSDLVARTWHLLEKSLT